MKAALRWAPGHVAQWRSLMQNNVDSVIPVPFFFFLKKTNINAYILKKISKKRHKELLTVDTFQEKSGMEDKLPFYCKPFS